jgi:hypothetical protein
VDLREGLPEAEFSSLAPPFLFARSRVRAQRPVARGGSESPGLAVGGADARLSGVHGDVPPGPGWTLWLGGIRRALLLGTESFGLDPADLDAKVVSSRLPLSWGGGRRLPATSALG